MTPRRTGRPGTSDAVSRPWAAIQITHMASRAMKSASSSDVIESTMASKSRSSNVDSRIQPEMTSAPMMRMARTTMLRTLVVPFVFSAAASRSAS